MSIVVVGPGAIGCLFAALLVRCGRKVVLLDRRVQRAQLLARSGLRVDTDSSSFTCSLPVLPAAPGDASPASLVLLCTKAYDTVAAAQAAEGFVGPGTLVLSLQNGIGNAEQLEKILPGAHIACAVTRTGSTLLGPGHIRQFGVASMALAPHANDDAALTQEICEDLSSAGIDASFCEDAQSLVWSKAVVNAGINPVTALGGFPNGAILDDPVQNEMMSAAVGEGEAVARAAGITLLMHDAREEARRVCMATAQNLSSMLQDVRQERRTEIESINGKIVGKGDQLGIPVSVNRHLLTAVLQMEEQYSRR